MDRVGVRHARHDLSLDGFCQLLGLQQKKHASRIKQQLGPSLDELRDHAYIGSWKLSPTRDGKGFKVELFHGAKFHRDLRLRQGEKFEDDASLTLPMDGGDEGGEEARPDLMAELTRRGITPKMAQQILERARDHSGILDQLEWGDHLVRRNRERIYNPAGFYVSLLRENVPIPAGFETSRMRVAREAARVEREDRQQRHTQLEIAYQQYCHGEVERHIEATYTGEEFAQKVDEQKERLLQDKKHAAALGVDFSRWRPEALQEYAVARVRREVSQQVSLPSFQEYVDATRGGALS